MPAACRTVAWLLAALACWVLPPAARAHDLPEQLRVHAFVKPEGGHLRVLLRLPLDLLLNLDLPKRGPGFLDLPGVESQIPRILAATARGIGFYADGRRLVPGQGQGRVALPSDPAFGAYDTALAAIQGERLAPGTEVFWNQGYFDALFDYPVDTAQARFAVDFAVSPGLADRLKLELRFIERDGTVRAFELPTGTGPIELDPRWHQAAYTFVKSGFAHILEGVDHLLFLLCLVAPFRRIGWTLVAVVSSFTVAHSITLICAAYGIVPGGAWFPPLVETLIALSIVYMAIENVLRPRLERRWVITFVFGLVHGFGFSFLLTEQLQLAGSHLLLSLLAFNLGIELGQLLVLAIVIPLLVALTRPGRLPDTALTALVSLLVGHTAWHWMSERAEGLAQLPWPEPEAIAEAMVYLGVAVAAAVGLRRWQRSRGAGLAAPPELRGAQAEARVELRREA